MRQRRQAIDLSAHLATCDANYHRVSRLLRGRQPGTVLRLGLALAQGGEHLLQLQEVERFPYTSTVTLSIHNLDLGSHCPRPQLQLRLYHDAMTAEVISFGGDARFQGLPMFDLPLAYQADEKEQLNRLLAEWLTLCLDKGYHADMDFADALHA